MYLTTIVSALLYALSFLTYSFWWTIVFFTIPITSTQKPIREGTLWGIIGFGLPASGILLAVMHMQNGSIILKITSSLIVIIYLALHAGIWMWIRQKCSIFSTKALIKAAIDTLFFMYISYASLAPFGFLYGYPLANPLLPLMNGGGTWYIAQCFGIWGSLYILFFSQQLLIDQHRISNIIGLIGITLWFIPIPLKESIPAWVNTIIPLTMQWSHEAPPDIIHSHIEQFIEAHPDKKIIITPESSIYNQKAMDPKIIQGYYHKHDITLIIGSFSKTTHKKYNTLFCISNGVITMLHHKQHALFFIESIPQSCAHPTLKTLYCDENSIESAPKKENIWLIYNGIFIEPYTCSEFFCTLIPRSHHTFPFLICCNDSWFTGLSSHIAKLMVTDARLKSAVWKRECLYIGYRYAGYITKEGRWKSFSVL